MLNKLEHKPTKRSERDKERERKKEKNTMKISVTL